MYYRKKYTGSITNFSTKKTFRFNNNAGSYSAFEQETEILDNAVIDILHDIGYPNARRDATTGFIYFDTDDQVGFFLGYMSNNTQISFGVNLTSNSLTALSLGNSGTTYQPFDTTKTTYSFYITIIGEPKGYFQMCIGSYTYPAGTNYAVLNVFMGRNLVTNEEIMAFTPSNGSTPPTTMTVYGRENLISAGVSVGMNDQLTGDDTSVILMRKRPASGIHEIRYTYTGVTKNLTAGQQSFYRLGDGVYWVPSQYYIVKCVTEVQTS